MRQLLVFALVMFTPTACSKKHTSAENLPNDKEAQQNFANELVGQWTSKKCETFPASDLSKKSFLRFDQQNTVEAGSVFYEGAECGRELWKTSWLGTYIVRNRGAKVQNSFVVSEIFGVQFMTLLADAVVKECSESKCCGFSDWKINQRKRTGGPSESCSYSAAGDYTGGSVGYRTEQKAFLSRNGELDMYSETRGVYLETFQR